jgi:hypothetical protein
MYGLSLSGAAMSIVTLIRKPTVQAQTRQLFAAANSRQLRDQIEVSIPTVERDIMLYDERRDPEIVRRNRGAEASELSIEMRVVPGGVHGGHHYL